MTQAIMNQIFAGGDHQSPYQISLTSTKLLIMLNPLAIGKALLLEDLTFRGRVDPPS